MTHVFSSSSAGASVLRKWELPRIKSQLAASAASVLPHGNERGSRGSLWRADGDLAERRLQVEECGANEGWGGVLSGGRE